MKQRIATIGAVMAALLMLGAVPAFAQDAPRRAERPARDRTQAPPWTGQSVDELRERIGDRLASFEERVTGSDRLTDEQKDAVLEDLAATREALEATDERAELVGTLTSRVQLQRLELRATKQGFVVDYDAHIARDVEGTTVRLDFMAKVAGWAGAAGEDVATITEYLDEASILLEIAGDDGTVEERHDAVHVARAWMTEASVLLLAM